MYGPTLGCLLSGLPLLVGMAGCSSQRIAEQKASTSQPATCPVRGDVSKPDPNRIPNPRVKCADPYARPTPKVVALMKRFQDALAECDWKTALDCCSDQVRTAAAGYDSPEQFFERVAPVDKIVALCGMPVCGYSGKLDRLAYSLVLNLVEGKGRLPVQWIWQIKPVGDRYQIEFQTIPLDQWIAQETARRDRERLDYDQARALLEPKLEGISTRLTPTQERFRVGEPICFRLELINNSQITLQYDDQQVEVNGSMKITDPSGQLVPPNVPCVQTVGGPRSLAQGETAVLFDHLDIAKQYPIKKPGRYKVQFNGHGLEIWVTGDQIGMPELEGIGTERAWPSNKWRPWLSNTVEIVVE